MEVSDSAPETLGSDEVRKWCESCKDDGKEILAIGFCTNCEEYMCRGCCEAHRKPRKLRDHVIFPVGNEDKIAEDEHTIAQRSRDVCTEKCRVHREKIIEYFCKTHEQLCCTACSVTNHKTCEDVIYIPDAVTGLAESDDFLQLTKQLKALEDNLVYNIVSIKTNIDAARAINAETKKQNATLHREITELIKTKKTELDSEADSILNKDTEKMKNLEEKSDRLIKSLEKINTKLKEVKESGQLCQLFVSMKKAEIEAKLLEDKVHEIEETSVIQRYAYEPNAKIIVMKETLDNIGKLVPEHAQKSLASHWANIDIASDCDKNRSKCCISGLAIVSEEHIVATDMENNSAKLIDTTFNKLVYTLLLQSAPRDVTKVTDKKVVLTLPDCKKVQFLSVSVEGTLKTEREVPVGGKCYGIVCNRKELIVSFIPSLFIHSSKIKILDMDGNVLKTLTQQLIGSPGYLALNKDQSTLYVSDWGNGSVSSMSMKGKIIDTYCADDLKMPHGLVCTRGGSVLVCGRQSNNIHQLSANCDKVQVLLNTGNGLVEPFSVAFSDQQHTLYIGMDRQVKVFSVI